MSRSGYSAFMAQPFLLAEAKAPIHGPPAHSPTGWPSSCLSLMGHPWYHRGKQITRLALLV